MNIKQEIIIDLLPLYFEGCASKETVELIEEYFEQHPKFAKSMKSLHNEGNQYNEETPALGISINPDDKLKVLKKTQKMLRIRSSLFIAGMVSILVPMLVSNFQQPDWVSQYLVMGWFVAIPIIWLGYFWVRYQMRTNGSD